MSDPMVPDESAEPGEVDLFDVAEATSVEEPAVTDDGVEEALAQVAHAARDVERELVASGELDPDEDLFNFGPMPGLDIDPLTEAAQEVEGVLAGLGQSGAEGAQPAGEQPGAGRGFVVPALEPAAVAAAVVELQAAREAERRPVPYRPLLVAAALVLALNLGLVFGALHLSSSLRSDLASVRGDISATARDLRQSLSQPAQVAAAPAAKPEPVEEPLPGVDELALAVAREDLESGLYASARRRLARLLVTIDARPAERRDALEARASYLIAESWAREAAARRRVKP